jgi:hypothetical protein
MREHVFDEFTRGAAESLTRRHSLVTLGGAVLATAIAAPRQAQAGKNGKKAKKRGKKKCKRQVEACRQVFIDFCETNPDECEEGELEEVFPCCALLKDCKAGESVGCFFDLVIPVPQDRRPR